MVVIGSRLAVGVLEGDAPDVVADHIGRRRREVVTDGVPRQAAAAHQDIHQGGLACSVVSDNGNLLPVLQA